jgi:hypothetical protein
MLKGILAVALLGLLTAGFAYAGSNSNLRATPINGALDQAVQVRQAFAVEHAAAPSPALMAPAMVKGHATDLGSSTPQPVGPVSPEPATSIPAPQAPHAVCPAGSHLGIRCTAP